MPTPKDPLTKPGSLYTKEQILAMDPNAQFGPSIQGGYWDGGVFVPGTNYAIGDWKPTETYGVSNNELRAQMEANPTWQEAQSYDQSMFKEFITIPAIFASLIAGGAGISSLLGGVGGAVGTGIGAGAAATPGLGAGAAGVSGGLTGAGIYGGGAGLTGGLSGAALEGFLNPEAYGLAPQTGLDASWGANPMGYQVAPGTGAPTQPAYDYNAFLESIGIDPAGVQFSGGTATNAGIMADILGGAPNSTNWLDYLNKAKSVLGIGGGGNGNNMGLLGGLLGAIAGGLGGSQKPAGTTTSIQDIPDYLKPYQTMNLTSGVQNFQASGLGGAILPGAMQQMGKTINGDYLDPSLNPAFQPYAKDLMGNALSTFNGQYGGSAGGNLNNSGFQEGAARAITNAALPLYNQAYQFERGNQINAAGQAPAFASNYAGAALAPNLAFKNLYSGPQATTTPYFTNPGAGIFSGGLAGLTLGNAFGKG